MHQSSLDKMAHFVECHLSDKKDQPLTILDLGSMDINGSYKPFFNYPKWHYQGADLEAGKNVDVVLSSPYAWKEIKKNSQDVVISGQTFEHMDFFWVGLQCIERAVKPGGLICIIAPSRGYEHRYPVDCWRFYPDGFRALAKYCGLELLEVNTQWENKDYTIDDSDSWGDTMAVYRKPIKRSWKGRGLLFIRYWIDRL